MFKSVYYDPFRKKMHLWHYENGKNVYSVLDHEIEYYIKDPEGKSEIKSKEGIPVIKRIAKDRNSLKLLKDAGEILYESDLKETVKFLHKRYGHQDFPVDIKQFNIYNIDIETEYPDSETINLIGLEEFNTGEIIMFGLGDYTGEDKSFYYVKCNSEQDLLEKFCKFLKFKKVSVLCGWNIEEFDIPKIQERITALNLSCSMSPIDKTKVNYDGSVEIAGIEILDCMLIYEKFTAKSQPSFSLEYIGQLEVQEGKVEYIGSINSFWKSDWNRFCVYNAQDLRLVTKIDRKKGFINLAINLCMFTRTPISNVASTIAVIEGYVLKYMHKNNMVMTDIQHNIDFEKTRSVEGGYVESCPGFYINACSIDATALYPSVIMMFNVCKEMKVLNPPEHLIPNLIKTPVKGVYYKKGAGVLSNVVNEIFTERKRLKNLMKDAKKKKDYVLAEFYNGQQLIMKTLANGVYGADLEPHFHEYDFVNGSVITAVGREAIKYVKKKFDHYIKNEFVEEHKKHFPNSTFNPDMIKNSLSILCDTDSRFFDLNYIYKSLAPEMKFLDFGLKFQETILEPYMIKIMKEFGEMYNTENKIHFKREKIISKIYVQAKKKYCCYNLANEEEIYDTPDFTVTGVETKKSDLCKFSRKSLNELLLMMFEGGPEDYPNKENMLNHIKKAKKEFMKSTHNEVCIVKGISDYDKYAVDLDKTYSNWLPKTPIYNKAAILYNQVLNDLGLTNYQFAKNGTKINYVHVKPNNKYKADVIGFIGTWPKEFDDMFVLDYEMQFEKQYLAICQRMFNILKFGEVILKQGKLAKLLVE